jgi:type VI secretion system protein ImpK
MSGTATLPAARTNSLALIFQEVITAILRVRFQRQAVADAESFRTLMRRSIQNAMQEARNQGYSGDDTQMTVLAVVGFLDESVLNSQNPAFADWARRPLQEELFGGHLAGETFFLNVRNLLGRQDSQLTADVLELHAQCLLLGYRGRYALGDRGELQALLKAMRDKIQRARLDSSSWLRQPPGTAAADPAVDRSVGRRNRWLLYGVLALVALSAACYGGFRVSLLNSLNSIAAEHAQ